MNTNTHFFDAIQQLHDDESGATATEYIILLILIACFVIGIVRVFGTTLSSKFGTATEALSTTVTF
jgi:Flp pilus assembly pilin Flp